MVGAEVGSSTRFHLITTLVLTMEPGQQIFATVGSDEKVRYLQETYNIPSDHILNSHNVSFRDALMTKTNKRGVDVVLNSLSGELLHASWDCVADFGVMAELGKRDIQERGKLDMSNFSRNRGYYAVDYEQILTENPVLNMRYAMLIHLLCLLIPKWLIVHFIPA